MAPSRPTPPGRKRSKGNRALTGARGVLYISGKRLARWRSLVAPDVSLRSTFCRVGLGVYAGYVQELLRKNSCGIMLGGMDSTAK